jgi:protein SCO1/2
MSVAQRTGLTLLLITVLAGAAFALITRGFNAITSDGVRRIDLASHPRPLPRITLIDSNGRRFRLSDISVSGKATLVALIYTHCPTICQVSAGGQNYLQREMRSRRLSNQVHLLTISFDPVRDTPDALAAYAVVSRNRIGAVQAAR